MARQRIDISSKWLLHNQGRGTLFVGGIGDVRRIESMPGELIQNRRYPDGLLRAYIGNEPKPHHVLVEVATYSERRARKQALDDLALAYSALGYLPELLVLILRPKGRLRIGDRLEVRSKLGLSSLEARWKPVELWTLPAEEFLNAGDVGVVPWVPLMQFEGPTETLLERCAEKIEREAPRKQRADLLAVTQVLTELRFPNPDLVRLLGGKELMIESPLMQKMMAEAHNRATLRILRGRFGTVPRDMTKRLGEIIDEERAADLNVLAAQCPDLQAFRDALLS
jgi:hypothetical protein